MKEKLERLKKKVLEGYQISKEEALALAEMPLEELTQAADEIRQKFCKNQFDLCTIINGKSGKCSENCKYCAQSSFYPTDVESYPLLGTEELLKQAEYSPYTERQNRFAAGGRKSRAQHLQRRNYGPWGKHGGSY